MPATLRRSTLSKLHSRAVQYVTSQNNATMCRQGNYYLHVPTSFSRHCCNPGCMAAELNGDCRCAKAHTRTVDNRTSRKCRRAFFVSSTITSCACKYHPFQLSTSKSGQAVRISSSDLRLQTNHARMLPVLTEWPSAPVHNSRFLAPEYSRTSSH